MRKDLFYFSQIVIGLAFIVLAWFFFRGRRPESNFRIREADLRKNKKSPSSALASDQDLAQARMKKKEPLRLSGIRIDGAPHEILGVREGASSEEIQKAYRERMKQYHPDRIAAPGTPQWHEAQAIAHAINNAKEALLKKPRG